MPFTPFHLGPGATVKAVLGRYFSFTLFGLTQVIIDLESLYYLVQGEWPVHRFLHSYTGATLVLLLTLWLGRPVCEFLLRAWNTVFLQHPGQPLYIPTTISRFA